MERKVGQPKLKSALAYTFVIFIFSYFLYDANAWQGIRLFAIILDVILIGIVIPGIAYCQVMWKVDKNKLYYTYHYSFIDKIMGFYQFLWHRKHVYQMMLNLDQIDYIKVTYQKVNRAPFGTYGYDLLFVVNMYDGSTYTFESLVTRDRETFCQAVEYLKNHGIQFKDSLKILDYLNTGGYLSYYLEKLEADQDD